MLIGKDNREMFNVELFNIGPLELAFISIVLFFRSIYQRRKAQRIKDANTEIIKIMIFYIINDKFINKQIFQEMYGGILAKYNLHSSKLYSIQRIMQEIHSFIISSKDYTDEQRVQFYENYAIKEEKIFECTPRQEPEPFGEKFELWTREIIGGFFIILIALLVGAWLMNRYGETTINAWIDLIWVLAVFSILGFILSFIIGEIASWLWRKSLSIICRLEEWWGGMKRK